MRFAGIAVMAGSLGRRGDTAIYVYNMVARVFVRLIVINDNDTRVL